MNQKLPALWTLNEWHIRLQRIILWSGVVVYTISLPHIIFVYNAIVKQFPQNVTGKIPFVIILSFGITYLVWGIISRKTVRCVINCIICAFIAGTIIALQPNPNKHIHIPEYIFMSWLLYTALSKDYKGGGIFVLIFICAVMLGVFDELMQGFHPGRRFGWIDMSINASSSFIGILMLTALKNRSRKDWDWLNSLKQCKLSIITMCIGLIGTVCMCFYLFDVKGTEPNWAIYPQWLLGWDGLIFVTSSMVIIYHARQLYTTNRGKKPKTAMLIDAEITTLLWLFCPLAILFLMHALVFWGAVSKAPFR